MSRRRTSLRAYISDTFSFRTLSLGGEIRHQRWLSTPAAIEAGGNAAALGGDGKHSPRHDDVRRRSALPHQDRRKNVASPGGRVRHAARQAAGGPEVQNRAARPSGTRSRSDHDEKTYTKKRTRRLELCSQPRQRCPVATSRRPRGSPAARLGKGRGRASIRSKPETPDMRFGMIALTDCSPIVIAHEKGLFKKYGINSTIVQGRELGRDSRLALERRHPGHAHAASACRSLRRWACSARRRSR